jgi:hypothetical protein
VKNKKLIILIGLILLSGCGLSPKSFFNQHNNVIKENNNTFSYDRESDTYKLVSKYQSIDTFIYETIIVYRKFKDIPKLLTVVEGPQGKTVLIFSDFTFEKAPIFHYNTSTYDKLYSNAYSYEAYAQKSFTYVLESVEWANKLLLDNNMKGLW